ncbi:MAG: hypothetical protein ACI9KE_005004 [Polyangiales bacterium]|jgi:hypothetical protein
MLTVRKLISLSLLLALAGVSVDVSAQESFDEEPVLSAQGEGGVGIASPAAMAPPSEEVAVDAVASAEADDAAMADPGDPTQSGLLSDEQVVAENELGVDERRSSTDPFEDPSETYMFLGAFYRHTWTPGFMLNLFLDESTPTNNSSFGLSFTYRKDSFDLITSVYYQGYGVDGPFLGSGDADTETEIINSDLFAVMLSVDMMWGTQFNDIIGIQYGLGIGVGALLGDLRRTEAYPDASVAGSYGTCTGTGGPGEQARYCDDVDGDGDLTGHTGIASKWFDGGSVPNIYFRFAVPNLAIRIKPIKQLLIRIDGGFDLFSGFFTGINANYGF